MAAEHAMHTRLTKAFGIRHPILCAPMALVTGGPSILPGSAIVLGRES